MASSGSFNTNGYEHRYLTFTWSVANQNVAGNETVINWSLQGAGSSPNTWYMSGNFKVVINGSTVYQSASRIQLKGNTIVASGMFVIGHNADGNKNFSASVEAGIYYFAVNARGSGSWDLPMIARATQPIVNKVDMAFGETLTIQTPRAAESFTHTIQAGVDGKLAFTNIATNVGTSYTWTLPKSWARYLTHSTDKLKIRVLTYHGGTHIGTKETPTVSVRATSDMAPVLQLTLSDANGYYDTYGGFVKGQSKIKAIVSETLYEGAMVSSRSLVLNGITYQSKEQTSEVISSLSQQVEARVVDSRGMVGTKVVTPIVYDWYPPKITVAKAERCQASGTLDESGNYIKLTYACAVASVNNRNQKQLSYRYQPQNQSSGTSQTIAMDSYNKTGSVIFPASGERSWEVILSLQDAFTTSQVTINVGTAFVLLDFHQSGKGIGVGKVAELQNTLDISPNWNLKYKNGVIGDFVVSQTNTGGWHCRKWHSGYMELFTRKQITININNGWGSLYTSGYVDALNIAYPTAFVEMPVVSVSLSPNRYGAFVMVTGNVSHVSSLTKTGGFEIVRPTATTNATFTVNYHIFGKWKN